MGIRVESYRFNELDDQLQADLIYMMEPSNVKSHASLVRTIGCKEPTRIRREGLQFLHVNTTFYDHFRS